ncbi:MAG: hypothetical protein P8J37_16910 [Fuerstiella sp.]|nr:hypothetical protein [Fuerstiella sp.]
MLVTSRWRNPSFDDDGGLQVSGVRNGSGFRYLPEAAVAVLIWSCPGPIDQRTLSSKSASPVRTLSVPKRLLARGGKFMSDSNTESESSAAVGGAFSYAEVTLSSGSSTGADGAAFGNGAGGATGAGGTMAAGPSVDVFDSSLLRLPHTFPPGAHV